MSRKNIKYKNGTGLFDTISDFFSPKKGYNNKSKKTLEKYGNDRIIQLQLVRVPIQSFIEPALNLISLGEFDKAKKKYNIDQLFHLLMLCTVELPNRQQKIIKVEKNEVINITDEPFLDTKYDTYIVPLKTYDLTLNKMLDNTEKDVGKDKYFSYSGLTNNCFMFLEYILKANNLYNDDIKHFLFIDLSEMVEELKNKAPHTRAIMDTITGLAGTFNKLIGGKHKEIIKHYHNLGYKLHDVVINKEIPFETAVQEAYKIIKGNKHYYRETKNTYRFRNIAKEKFKPNTFRSKKINKHITLIFGQLKNI